ncbi:hypothetical protein UT5_05990 [Ferrigenium sp. UT5]
MPACDRSPLLQHRQNGGAMLVMLVILVIGITTVFITSLSESAIRNKRVLSSADALARAKEALIGFAISYGDTHPEDPLQPRDTAGYLPCPDINASNGEGSSNTCGTAGANSMGRLPWRTLGLTGILDGQQDCLWYAVSGNYKNNPKYGGTMNWDTPAQLHVFDSNGGELEAGEVVAVIISPGTPLPGNAERAGTTTPICRGNYTASAYLDNDTEHGINNADISQAKFIMPHDHRDANGNITLSTNDQFVYITRQDIWTAAEKRIAREAKQCLDDYAASAGGKYPLATSVSMTSAPSLFGRLSATINRSKPRAADLAMVRSFESLIPVLLTFRNNRTLQNFSAIDTPAANAKSAADNVKDYYDGINNTLESAADQLKDAAATAKDWNPGSWPSTSSINNVLNQIYNASATFSSNLPVDTGMPSSWPTSCTLFTSERWTTHWKDLIFYQLADGYKPGSSSPLSCGSSCLGIEVSGHSAPGSGSYRAVIIGSGKMLNASRDSSVIGDYLDVDNLLPQNDVSKPYKTYRTTDVAHQNTNDLVLCLDGGSGNCR